MENDTTLKIFPTAKDSGNLRRAIDLWRQQQTFVNTSFRPRNTQQGMRKATRQRTIINEENVNRLHRVKEQPIAEHQHLQREYSSNSHYYQRRDNNRDKHKTYSTCELDYYLLGYNMHDNYKPVSPTGHY
eukprot:361493-Amphidinium_carterae.1